MKKPSLHSLESNNASEIATSTNLTVIVHTSIVVQSCKVLVLFTIATKMVLSNIWVDIFDEGNGVGVGRGPKRVATIISFQRSTFVSVLLHFEAMTLIFFE